MQAQEGRRANNPLLPSRHLGKGVWKRTSKAEGEGKGPSQQAHPKKIKRKGRATIAAPDIWLSEKIQTER